MLAVALGGLPTLIVDVGVGVCDTSGELLGVTETSALTDILGVALKDGVALNDGVELLLALDVELGLAALLGVAVKVVVGVPL